MRTYKVAIFAIIAVILPVFAGASAADVRSAKKAAVSRLVAQLPDSDVVAVVDTRRFFDDALPKLLAANQPILTKVLAKLDLVQQRTGIDLRKFDEVAIGAKSVKRTTAVADLDAVILAQGSYSSGALVAVVKLASNGAYREETIGGRTVYVFSAKNTAAKGTPQSSTVGSAVERAMNGLTNEVAVTALDVSTLAFGSLERVRQTIEGKTSVRSDLASLLAPNAIASFAAKTPDGTSKLLPLDNDELGKTLDSIRFVAGSMDVAEGNLSGHLLARTARPEQAQNLLDTLQGLQMLGKNILGGSKRAEQQILARTIENAKIARTANDVTIDLSLPQGDVDALVGMIR